MKQRERQRERERERASIGKKRKSHDTVRDFFLKIIRITILVFGSKL